MFSRTDLVKLFGSSVQYTKHLLPLPRGPKDTWLPEQLLSVAYVLKSYRKAKKLLTANDLAGLTGYSAKRVQSAALEGYIPQPIQYEKRLCWHESMLDDIREGMERFADRRSRPDDLLSNREMAKRLGISLPAITLWLQGEVIPDLRVTFKSQKFWPAETVGRLLPIATERMEAYRSRFKEPAA